MDAADPRGRAVLEAARAVHAGDARRLAEHRRRSRSRARPARSRSRGVEWVDTRAATPADTARAVAAALWHHFDGPRAQRLANDTVFRFDDGRIDPAQARRARAICGRLSAARASSRSRAACRPARVALNAYLHELALERMTRHGPARLRPRRAGDDHRERLPARAVQRRSGHRRARRRGRRRPSLPRGVPRRRRARAVRDRGAARSSRARVGADRAQEPGQELDVVALVLPARRPAARHARAAVHRRSRARARRRDRAARAPCCSPAASGARCAHSGLAGRDARYDRE